MYRVVLSGSACSPTAIFAVIVEVLTPVFPNGAVKSEINPPVKIEYLMGGWYLADRSTVNPGAYCVARVARTIGSARLIALAQAKSG